MQFVASVAESIDHRAHALLCVRLHVLHIGEHGVAAEVIDLGTLKPYDRVAVRTSVAKTGRCVIVHEAPLTAGFGAEISADLAEHCLTSLLAPVRRVTGYDTVMPYPRIEQHYMPSAARILKAVRDVMEFT